jgi:hypothetical protein
MINLLAFCSESDASLRKKIPSAGKAELVSRLNDRIDERDANPAAPPLRIGRAAPPIAG